MSQENVEHVRRTLGHFMEAGEPLWEVIDDEIEVYDHDIPDRGEYMGQAGFVRWLQDWGEAWADWSVHPQEFLDAGDKVVAFLRMKATGHSGVSVERDDAIVYTLRDNLVVRIDYYNNRSQALEAAGLSE
jgi:ketosteroid isomerase-like protein